MPRQPRTDEAGMIYRALNRGNRRQTIFQDRPKTPDPFGLSFSPSLASHICRSPKSIAVDQDSLTRHQGFSGRIDVSQPARSAGLIPFR